MKSIRDMSADEYAAHLRSCPPEELAKIDGDTAQPLVTGSRTYVNGRLVAQTADVVTFVNGEQIQK